MTIFRCLAPAFVAAGLLVPAGGVRANNLVLTNVMLKPLDDTRAFVQFDLSWENSWRYTNINHDAAWVFFKVKPEGRSAWEHATLETNEHDTGSGTPVEVLVPEDRVGCFIRRTGEGAGALSVTNLRIAWNFASNGLVKTDRVRIRAMALEMVFVAESAFFIGSGGSGDSEFFTYPDPNLTYGVTNNDAIQVGTTNGHLFYAKTSYGGDQIGPIPDAYPKGYSAFYCMKYEITQGQYRDFLNSLTRAQQNMRTAVQNGNAFAMSGGASVSYRNGIRCPFNVPLYPGIIVFGCDANANLVFNETDDGMDRACNWLAWSDGAAFTDWAGLRPFTELEFEKACRGPLDPVPDEYAFGDIGISPTTGMVNDGSGMERATNGNCNVSHCTPDGPYRSGVYASTNTTRNSAGASYWGIMELSGNLHERIVSTGSAEGRAFTGVHGDGALDGSGNANATNWPSVDSGGSGLRGGCWKFVSDYARLSHRRHAACTYSERRDESGFRAARQAPAGVGP